jgi:hypothetical protein
MGHSGAWPVRVASFTHVEFIYTPDNPKFDCVFNGLNAAQPLAAQRFDPERVDALYKTLFVGRNCSPYTGRDRRPGAGGKVS